ncbi:MAG: tRNA lysidine(34) synthetase TilS [Actinobacteria bacterium]|nr:tRNA lysidine(34) synthetase TilS [Actinomycetota bacterium]MCG2820136.1 tRNA lysidine(34) synthetase TilS [Actinomycetes bacterium]MBU4219215.1 tRNA lysidine(34) synthetase TilS [Actinomycetota bacterium]MBU4359058.1 tRNA lysidine(34) synthetase TilS [Actinomycetota bacterium]MBU4392931.1 tRNA lysidine(34) synthetase TilS [Actinomycetota bacterium]
MRDEGGLRGKALDTIKRYRMLSPGDRVVVGVSGGADSVALLLFLSGLSGTIPLDLHVFHLDHMLRGPQSAGDAEFTGCLAEELGLPARLEAVDVREVTSDWGRSPEDAARMVRIGRLLDYAREVEADAVASGHTADDQVETFLMRVIQGAGLTGLGGISPVSGLIVRPLINVWRWEVEEYCSRMNVVPRRDSSNLDRKYLRNRIRLDLIPYLVDKYGSGVKEVIWREVESLAVDREFIERQVADAFDRAAEVGGGEVRIEIEALMSLPESLRRGIVRKGWARLMPFESNLSWRHIADILEKVAGGATGARLDLPRRVEVEREYGQLVLRRSLPRGEGRDGGANDDVVIHVPVPGSARLPGAGMTLQASFVGAGEMELDQGPLVEFVRSDLALPLEVRAPRPGERFHPLGSPGRRKVSDFLIDMKVPRRRRRECRLVLSGGEVVWLAGYRLDERFRLRPTDSKALRLILYRDREYDGSG